MLLELKSYEPHDFNEIFKIIMVNNNKVIIIIKGFKGNYITKYILINII